MECERERENLDKIILFDGICHFCDRSVQFIIKYDPTGIFKFASLQSNTGKKLLEHYNIPTGTDSLVLIEDQNYSVMSTAALRICKHLDGLWKLGYLLILIPKPIRDFFYRIFAKNRYKWFGQKQSCPIPPLEIRDRFF